MTRRLLLFAAAVTALSATASAAEGREVLRSWIAADIRGTNPGVDRDAHTDVIHQHLFEGLVGYRGDFEVGPMLAAAIEVSEDGLTYRFALREGVRFHNGAEMTAETVAWSWQRLLDPATNWRCREVFSEGGASAIETIETPDAATVVFRLAAPSPAFLDDMARIDCGAAAVVHPDSLDGEGNWREPVGTGPFRLKEWRAGEFVELERFDDYSARDDEPDGMVGAKRVSLDGVRWKILPEPSVARTALGAGELDLVNVSTRFVGDFDGRAGLSVSCTETGAWETLLIQSADPQLADPRIRQAIVHAIDRDGLVEAATNGLGRPNPSPVPMISSFYSEAMAQGLDYDPERARALLQEAGYDGERLVLQTNRRYQSMYDRALIVQAMLRAVGLNLDLEVLEWGTQLDNYQSGAYQLQSFGYSARLTPAASFEMFTGPQSRKAWKDEEAIALLEQAFQARNRDGQQALFDELHRRFTEEAPAVGLYHSPDCYVLRDTVEGFSAWSGGMPRFWGVSLNR